MPFARTESDRFSGRDGRPPRDAIGDPLKIPEGAGVHCLSDGSWGMQAAVELLADALHRPRIAISTWTVSEEALAEVADWREAGRVAAVRWIFDRSLISRHPRVFARAGQLYGIDAVRLWMCHAKFAVVASDAENLALMSSANMNRNRNVEQFSVFRGGETPRALTETIDALFARQDIRATLRLPKSAQADTDAIVPPVPTDEIPTAPKRLVRAIHDLRQAGASVGKIERRLRAFQAEIEAPAPAHDDDDFVFDPDEFEAELKAP